MVNIIVANRFNIFFWHFLNYTDFATVFLSYSILKMSQKLSQY